MKKKISRTLSGILIVGMIVTSLPAEVFADTYQADPAGGYASVEAASVEDIAFADAPAENIYTDVTDAGNALAEEADNGDALTEEDATDKVPAVEGILTGDEEVEIEDTDAEMTVLDEVVEEASDEEAVADFAENDNPETDMTSLTENNYVTDAAWAVDKNDKDNYVGDGNEYMYSSYLTGTAQGERELFSAIHNDIILGEHEGKWYEGHEVIYYPAEGKKVYADKNSTDTPLVTAPAFTGNMVFEMKYLPAELSDQFYHHYKKNDETWTYESLKAEKLYAWEYEPYTVGSETRYKRVKTVEITSGNYEVFTETGKKYTNNESISAESDGYTKQITLSGNVVLNGNDFKDASHPIAIVALCYDAAKNAEAVEALAEGNETMIWNNDPKFAMRTAGYGSTDNSIYNRSYNYYRDDIYTAATMTGSGNFSLNPYNYYINDTDNTLTLYGCTDYNGMISSFMRGYKDDMRDQSGSGLIIDTWEIPASYNGYQVVIYNHVDEYSESYNYYSPYPNMTTNLIIEGGVTFPEDCTALLGVSSMYALCPDTITIAGDTASVGSNIKRFSNIFAGGTYSRLDIKALDTSGAEDMSEMFRNVILNPKTVSDIPDLTHFDTGNVTDMSRMFNDMRINASSTAYNVNVSNLNTSNVTDFSHMFDGYRVMAKGAGTTKYFTSVDTTKWDTGKASDMSWMFANMLFMEYTGTNVLNLSGLDFTPALKSMQGMFYGNRGISEYGDGERGLTKIIFPANMDTSGVTDMSLMFANCSTLSQVENFTALDTDNVIDMSEIFGTALEDRFFGSVRYTPEPADTGESTGSWAEDRLYKGCGVSYYHAYPGDFGPAFSSLDLTNFNTKKVEYAYGMFSNMKNLSEIKWGTNTTFESLTDATYMFILPNMASLDLTGRKISSVKFAHSMMELENADEIILGENSLDLTHIDKSMNGRFSLSAPILSMDFSNVILGAGSFDADSLYNNYTTIYNAASGLDAVEELIFPAGVPAFTAPARLRTTFFDSDSNAYDYYRGGNSKALRLTTSAAGYEITDFKAGNSNYGYGLVGNGGTLDITMGLDEDMIQNNLSALFYVDGNSGIDAAKLTPAPDISWRITAGDAVGIETATITNTNDTVYLKPEKTGTATITLTVNGGEYTATFNATVYDKTAEAKLYSADGSIYKANVLSDGTYMVTGYDSLASAESIDLTGLKLGSASGTNVTVSRIGKDAFSQGGSDYSLRDTMKTLKIPASVTYIGESAFYNMTKLETVTIETGSGLKSIGDRAFSDAGSSNGQSVSYDDGSNPIYNFTKKPFSINLPEGLEIIGDGAFASADLATIVIPSTVKSIGSSCFSGDGRLTSAVIKTTCLESIPENLFNGKMRLESIKDGDDNDYGFEGCIRIGDCAFYNCMALTGSFSSNSLRYIGKNAFASGMGSGVPITGFTAPNVVQLGDSAFERCFKMKTAVFPSLKEIPYHAFDLCSIETLDISSAVTIGQQAFSRGLSMNKVVLPDTLATIGTQAFEMNDTVKEYKLPDSLHTIGAQAFAGNIALGSIIIPDSVTSIASSYNGAFSGCSSLEEATIGSGISEIPDRLFYGCPIKKLTMGNNITAIGNEAFSGAALNEIYLPSSLRSIGESAFKEAYYGVVKYGGEAVEGGVSTIIIPYGVTEIPKKSNGDITAFKGKQTNDYSSTYIRELYLPETVQDLSGLDLRVLFKENPADKQLEYMEEGNTTPQHVYTYDGKIYYPGTRSELEAAVFAENKDQYGNTISQGYKTYGEYNVLDLFDIEYGTGWKKVNGKNVFYKEGSPVKAEAGGYTVQEAGDYYYLLDENGEYVRDRAYVDKEGTGAGAKYYIYYFGSNGVGERHEITAEAITAESAVYGFFNNTVHAAMKVSGGVPGLVRGVSDVPEAETLSSLKASDGEHKYFAYTDGTLAKGYVAGSANDGYYFDDYDKKDGRLVWYADYSVSSAKYYTDTAKANALGGNTGASFPDKDGNMVTYKNGIMLTLTGDDLSMSASPAFDAGTSNVTLYTGGDSSETSTEHPSKGTVTLTVSSDKGINLTKAGVRWSISTQFPRTAGMKVLSIKDSTALDTLAGTSTVTFTALSAGTARLRATVTDGDTGVTAYKECVVTVKELDNMPEGVSVTAEKTILALGGTTTITAKLLPENTTFKQGYDKISFTLSGKNAQYFALTDNGNGTADIKAPSGLLNDDGNTVTVTIIAAARNGVSGRIRITATSEGGGDNPGPSPSPEPVPVGDEAYVTGVALNKGEASLYPGDVLKLSATVNPANAKDKTVTWATSNADVVTVDNTGKVTAVAAGTDASGSPAAAKAVITATAKGSESGKTVTAACTVTVLPKEIVDTDKDGNIIDPSASGSGVKTKDESSGEANIWVAGIDNNGYYYTGNAIKPAIHVYKGYKLLTEKTDYTLVYKNNKNVSKSGSVNVTENKKKPQIIIKMKGAYSGNETAYFNIIPMPIDKLTADNDMFSVEYKAGKKNQLKPTLMYEGNKVKYNAKDITFKWYEADESGNATETESECIEAKTYVVKAFAGESGNYSNPSGEGKSGHKVATVIVSGRIPMSKVKLEGFRNKLAYEGGKAVSQNAILTYKDKGVKSTLSECKVPGGGGDYTVTHMNNYDLGTATVIYEAARDASGKYTGKYSGKVVKTYKIAGKYTLKEGDGGNCVVSLNAASYPYANAQIKPEVKVTATIINNKGEQEKRVLVQGKDYTVSYKNNKAVAKADAKNPKNGKDVAPQVIVKGKGNYVFADTPDMKKGVVKRFEIRKADLGRDVILTISDIAYNKTANRYKKTKFLFTDKDYKDLKLKEGKDYTVSYTTSDRSEAPAAGQSVAVTITAKDGGSCTGSVTGSYRITDRNNTDISKVKVVVNPNDKGKTQPCTYTGSGIEPKKDGKPDLILTIGSGRNAKTLKPRTVGTDGKVGGNYEILGYYNNIFPGSSAVILIRGIGDYRGIRAVKFKISAVKVANRWGGIYGQSK